MVVYIAQTKCRPLRSLFLPPIFLIANISSQLDAWSIIVTTLIYTVFIYIETSGSTSSKSHFIFQEPYRSTNSSSQDLMILSSLNGRFLSLTTLVDFIISLHVLHVAVISLHKGDIPRHVMLALTFSSDLLYPG